MILTQKIYLIHVNLFALKEIQIKSVRNCVILEYVILRAGINIRLDVVFILEITFFLIFICISLFKHLYTYRLPAAVQKPKNLLRKKKKVVEEQVQPATNVKTKILKLQVIFLLNIKK